MAISREAVDSVCRMIQNVVDCIAPFSQYRVNDVVCNTHNKDQDDENQRKSMRIQGQMHGDRGKGAKWSI